jgi:hypothetical protein
MSDATPRPWAIGKPYIWHGHRFLPIGQVRTAESAVAKVTIIKPVASVQPEDDARNKVHWSERDTANARLIVRAVNAHDAMLAALKDIAGRSRHHPGDGMMIYLTAPQIDAIEAMIKAAEEKP